MKSMAPDQVVQEMSVPACDSQFQRISFSDTQGPADFLPPVLSISVTTCPCNCSSLKKDLPQVLISFKTPAPEQQKEDIFELEPSEPLTKERSNSDAPRPIFSKEFLNPKHPSQPVTPFKDHLLFHQNFRIKDPCFEDNEEEPEEETKRELIPYHGPKRKKKIEKKIRMTRGVLRFKKKLLACSRISDWWFGRKNEDVFSSADTSHFRKFCDLILNKKISRNISVSDMKKKVEPVRTETIVKSLIFKKIFFDVLSKKSDFDSCFPSQSFQKFLLNVKEADLNQCLMKRCLKAPFFREKFLSILFSEEFSFELSMGRVAFKHAFFESFLKCKPDEDLDENQLLEVQKSFPISAAELALAKSIFSKFI